MPLWVAAILGAVQGLAEFLPISSSGHLALVQSVLHFEQYNVVSFVQWVIDGFRIRNRPSRRLIVLLLLATLPLALGAVLEHYVKAAFTSTLFIGIALCFTAGMLWVASHHAGGKKTEADAPYPDGLKVGLWQLIALFPGVSRSGSTICGGLFSGFQKDFAVRFGFLLSIPAVCGAAVFSLPDLLHGGLDKTLLAPCIVGFVVSALCGYLAIFTVRLLMKKNSFRWFSLYCLAVGVLTIVLSL